MSSQPHGTARRTRLPWLTMVAVVAMTLSGAPGADNSIGTWKLNVEKSEYSPAPFPLKSLIVTREALEGGVKVTIKGQRENGVVIDAGYTAQYGGKPVAVSGTGTLYDEVTLAQLSPNTFTAEFRSTSSRYSGSERIQISAAGTTMYVVADGRDAEGKPFSGTLVFEKK